MYVADTFNDRIQKFTSDGNFTKEWGAWGSGPGQFSSPSGVAVDDDIGTVYVADTGNNRIQKFTSDGKHLSDFGEFGYDEDKFNYPMDVDIDSKGHIYVVDSGNNRIQKIEGSSIKTWIPLDESNPIAFDSPISITIDLLDNVYVSDMKNHKIYRFDVTGKNVKAVGEFGFNKQTLLPFWNSS